LPLYRIVESEELSGSQLPLGSIDKIASISRLLLLSQCFVTFQRWTAATTHRDGVFKAGFSGMFGGSAPEYSNKELAGVPLTGMSPLSPYLNVDPRYLVQDTDEFILPTGANKTRGRFELAFFTIGGSCMTGKDQLWCCWSGPCCADR
ncbi:mitochondrial import inner membrane translocase subunit Tim23-like, partial [Thalassophryne amazonica]|uniref:mitochondrial import inner membrane translocase subunit Tim23-like n=1 Tax=Thalassophryne amazonica TaxID=390379 RepID=UPI00147212F0